MMQAQQYESVRPGILSGLTKARPLVGWGSKDGEQPDTVWLAGILDALSAHIAVLDSDGAIVAVNSAWTRFSQLNDGAPGSYGAGANYLAAVRVSAEAGDASAAEALTGLRQVLTGEARQFDLEYPCHGANQQRWFLMQASPLPNGAGAVVSHINITDRKLREAELQRAYENLQNLNLELRHAQSQLLQAEKMASIGQLAAGVAHEINSPIGYLHSNLRTLEQYVQDLMSVVTAYERAEPTIANPALVADIAHCKRETDFAFLLADIPNLLAESREGAQRVRKIVRDLKDFAHSDDNDDWQWADLRHCLDSTLSIAANELRYKTEVQRDFGEIPEIQCLPGQLNQVFLNLLINAAQAIETQGVIRVRTWQEGEQVCVEIADTGAGIAPQTLDRIFEPFFTTKPVGKGTGLGLSISWGIVQKHRGHIKVDSEVGKGTRFLITLPVNGQPVTSN
jgi:signal transduction histidine kinase